MDYYKIINNRQHLIDFIDWLPILEDNETYYLSLFARKKYCSDLIKSNDKTQLKRFISSKEQMLNKIEQLELPMGRWILKDTVAPQESLVLYINPNPRCMKKATEMIGKKCWDLIKNKNYNIHTEVLFCIQQSKGRGCYVDFDIDSKSIDLNLIKSIIPRDAYSILETRGGYHLLVDPQLADKPFYTTWNGVKSKNQTNDWYIQIKRMFQVDQVGDQMIPVPGCVQGGFVPRFVDID